MSSSVRLSVRLSVTFVRPTQAIEIFRNILRHLVRFGKNFTEIVPGEPLRRGS